MESHNLIQLIVDRVYRHNSGTLPKDVCQDCFGTGVTISFNPANQSFCATVCLHECLPKDGEDLGDVGSVIWRTNPCETAHIVHFVERLGFKDHTVGLLKQLKKEKDEAHAALLLLKSHRIALGEIAAKGCDWGQRVPGFKCTREMPNPRYLICAPCMARMSLEDLGNSPAWKEIFPDENKAR